MNKASEIFLNRASQKEIDGFIKNKNLKKELKKTNQSSVIISIDEENLNKSKQFIKEHYLKTANPSQNICAAYFIYSPEQSKAYKSQTKMLGTRKDQDPFQPKWSNEVDAAERQEIYKAWEVYSKEYHDPYSTSGATEIPVWHATSLKAVRGIANTGFANLATTDAGFFGKGLYFTNSVKYAVEVYSPSGGLVILAYTSISHPYPVMKQDMKMLNGGAVYGAHDSHFVPVKPRYLNATYCKDYDALDIKNGDMVSDAEYLEFVIFQSGNCLPKFLVVVDTFDFCSNIASVPYLNFNILFEKLAQVLKERTEGHLDSAINILTDAITELELSADPNNPNCISQASLPLLMSELASCKKDANRNLLELKEKAALLDELNAGLNYHTSLRILYSNDLIMKALIAEVNDLIPVLEKAITMKMFKILTTDVQLFQENMGWLCSFVEDFNEKNKLAKITLDKVDAYVLKDILLHFEKKIQNCLDQQSCLDLLKAVKNVEENTCIAECKKNFPLVSQELVQELLKQLGTKLGQCIWFKFQQDCQAFSYKDKEEGLRNLLNRFQQDFNVNKESLKNYFFLIAYILKEIQIQSIAYLEKVATLPNHTDKIFLELCYIGKINCVLSNLAFFNGHFELSKQFSAIENFTFEEVPLFEWVFQKLSVSLTKDFKKGLRLVIDDYFQKTDDPLINMAFKQCVHYFNKMKSKSSCTLFKPENPIVKHQAKIWFDLLSLSLLKCSGYERANILKDYSYFRSEKNFDSTNLFLKGLYEFTVQLGKSLEPTDTTVLLSYSSTNPFKPQH